MRLLLLLLAFAAALPAPEPDLPAAAPLEFVQAVEFPYYLYPPALWERELVWLKTLGIHTVEFSIPWNWHQPDGGAWDFTGATSPRRDLMGFIHLLRRLEMRAWIRPLPPVKGWINNGYPQGVAQTRAGARPWLHEIENLLAPQTEKHGGPIAFVEGGTGVTGSAGAAPAGDGGFRPRCGGDDAQPPGAGLRQWRAALGRCRGCAVPHWLGAAGWSHCIAPAPSR